MLIKMRKDELSGRCILFVVAEVHQHVQKMKNPLGQTSESAVDLGYCPFLGLLVANERP